MKHFKSYFTPLINLYWATLSTILSDRNYIRALYKHRFGKSINLDSPKTFNGVVTISDLKTDNNKKI